MRSLVCPLARTLQAAGGFATCASFLFTAFILLFGSGIPTSEGVRVLDGVPHTRVRARVVVCAMAFDVHTFSLRL